MSEALEFTESGTSPPVAEEAGPRQRHRLTPPPPKECIRILRVKYPDALICTACGLLLATKRESYAKSNLTEEQRLAYVCAECRWEAAEKARIKTLRAENLRRNLGSVTRTRKALKGRVEGPQSGPMESATSSTVDRDRAGAYAAARDGLVKVGYTDNLPLRLRMLQATLLYWHPSHVASWVERQAHAHFAGQRKHGEWYALTASEIEALPTLFAQFEDSAPVLAHRHSPGRPRVPKLEQRRKARDRARACRARKAHEVPA